MKAAIIKAIIQLLADEKTRKRVMVLILSLVTGLLGMMIMPIIVLQTLGKMQPPDIAIDESTLLSGISTEQTAAMEADGQAIADTVLANPDNVLIRYMCLAGVHYERLQHHGLHILRHSMATHMLDKEIPITTIQSVMGHVSSESTKRYTAIDIRQLKECALEVPRI